MRTLAYAFCWLAVLMPSACAIEFEDADDPELLASRTSSDPDHGRVECPAGYWLSAINGGGGALCVDGTNAWGPFTATMVARCDDWGGGGACDTDRWAIGLATAAYGASDCPTGAGRDAETGYCLEGVDAFGPFPADMIGACKSAGGGEHACNSARWNASFMRTIYRNLRSTWHWRTNRLVGAQSALRDGEIVFTIDDGVGPNTRAMAQTLANAGISATFFPAAHNVGRSLRLDQGDRSALAAAWPPASTLSLNRAAVLNELVWIPRLGHTLANHTYSHPIAQPSRGIASFRDMAADERRAEVVDAHLLLRDALDLLDREAGLNGAARAAWLPWFRSPGNSWDARTADPLRVAPLRNYRGPIAWDLPAQGEEDFRCWADGLSVAACGERMIATFERMPAGQQRAIILLHEHPRSVELADYLIRRFRDLSARGTRAGNCIKMVPLRCTVGCDRTTLPAPQQRCAHW